MSAIVTESLSFKEKSPGQVPKVFGIDSRFVPPILITLILLVGQISYGILESYPKTALAIVTAIALEIVLGRLFAGKFPHLASAYITGISVGILVRSPFAWTFALCAAISIISKYVLRIKDRHLWNPSNFGITAMLFLAPWAVASLSIQWGNNLWPMLVIWVLGSIIIYRLKRFHLRRFVPDFQSGAKLCDRLSLSGRGRADYGCDVSTLHLFYDYRSEDYCAHFKNSTMFRRGGDCRRRNVFTFGRERPRALLRFIYRRPDRQFAGYLVAGPER